MCVGRGVGQTGKRSNAVGAVIDLPWGGGGWRKGEGGGMLRQKRQGEVREEEKESDTMRVWRK